MPEDCLRSIILVKGVWQTVIIMSSSPALSANAQSKPCFKWIYLPGRKALTMVKTLNIEDYQSM